MNTQQLRKQIKNNELILLNDGSKVSVTKDGKKYAATFDKLNYAMLTFDTLKETIEYIEKINNK